MSKVDQNYHKLLEEILWTGYKYPDPNRTGVERIEIPSYTFKHDFKDGFPAISTKKLHYKNVVTELIWFLRGDTNIKYLVDNGCNIWNKDAYNYYLNICRINDIKKTWSITTFINIIKKEEVFEIAENYSVGDLGPVYGKQWRNFNGVDQIQNLIKGLKEKPLGTEHIVNSWNAGELKEMALQPCHYGFQVVVRPLTINERGLIGRLTRNIFTQGVYKSSKELDEQGVPKYGFEIHWSQRSVDTFLGLPYNIASYATLALIIEKLTGYKALGIQGDLKKVHLYDNSIEAVNEQLSRNVNSHKKCELKIDDNWIEMVETQNLTIDEILNETEIDDFELINYESDPAIRVEMLERDE